MNSATDRDLDPQFAGLILAGGLGSRWGGPKAWACLPSGATFVDTCAGILSAAGADTVLATLPPGTPTSRESACARTVLPEPGLDMFSSLRHGLGQLVASASWSAVVILPVDHPLVKPETVRRLVAAGPAAAIPCHGGKHGHPLVLWRDAATRVVTGRLPGPTLRDVLREVEAHDVEVDDPGIRANCNTPDALLTALKSHER